MSHRHTTFVLLALSLLPVSCRTSEPIPPAAMPIDAGTAGDTAAAIVCPSNTGAMQKQLFEARCSNAGCHGTVMPALALDLMSPNLEGRLVGVASVGCRGEKLVVAGRPELSELYRKVAHAQPECGVRMPVGTSPYSEQELECLRRWIISLTAAMPDAGVPDTAPTVDTGGSADVPSAPTCPGGQNACSGSCVDLKVDNGNCGACGKACGPGTTCTAGTCACASGQSSCNGGCVDLTKSNLHCGACGRACGVGETCSAGACACTTGLNVCGGYCVDLSSNANHCGACGKVCGNGTVCAAGACVRGGCPSGTVACAGACVDTRSSTSNCGACGTVCAAGLSCVAGTCACASGTSACGGTCTNTSSDPLNCGGCGKACPAGSTCAAGSCGCSSGLSACGSSCVNLATSSSNCGACGKACTGGAACVNGACSLSCASGTTACNGSCVNTSNDAKNCGVCGKVCGSGEVCTAGTCVGCGPPVSFANQVQPIFNAGCTTACHSGNRPAANLSLVSGLAYAELVNVTSTCNGRKHVAPGSAQNSYLINKLIGVDMCSGSVMPKAGGELSAAQIEIVRAWICQGAPKN